MPIVLAIDLTFHEVARKVAPGTKQRKSATSVARAKLPSDAVFMTRFCKHHECDPDRCQQNSIYCLRDKDWCLRDKDGNHHAIDRETMRTSYAEIKEKVTDGENYEDVEDIEIPQHICHEILSRSKKRKADGNTGCRNCKTYAQARLNDWRSPEIQMTFWGSTARII